MAICQSCQKGKCGVAGCMFKGSDGSDGDGVCYWVQSWYQLQAKVISVHDELGECRASFVLVVSRHSLIVEAVCTARPVFGGWLWWASGYQQCDCL